MSSFHFYFVNEIELLIIIYLRYFESHISQKHTHTHTHTHTKKKKKPEELLKIWKNITLHVLETSIIVSA